MYVLFANDGESETDTAFSSAGLLTSRAFWFSLPRLSAATSPPAPSRVRLDSRGRCSMDCSLTYRFAVGGEDDRTYSKSGIGSKALGRQYGLDAHSRCEGDGESDILAATVGNAQRLTLLRLPSTASATREDFFLNNGDNHSQSPRRFRRFMEHAKNNGGQFNIDAAKSVSTALDLPSSR